MSHDPAATVFYPNPMISPHYWFVCVFSAESFSYSVRNSPRSPLCFFLFLLGYSSIQVYFFVAGSVIAFCLQTCCKIRLIKMEMLQGYPLRITFVVAPAILLTNWWYRHFLSQINVGRCPTLGLTMKLCFARSTLAANTCRLLQDYEKAMAKMAKKATHVMFSRGCLMLTFQQQLFLTKHLFKLFLNFLPW